MKIKSVLCFAVLLFLVTMSLNAFSPPLDRASTSPTLNSIGVYKSMYSKADEFAVQKFNGFKDSNPGEWSIRWNHMSQTPFSLRGKSKAPLGNDPVAAAKAFIRKSRLLFSDSRSGISESIEETDDLKVDLVCKNKNTSHVQFQQYFGNIKVYNSGIRINMDASNNVLLVNGNYRPDVVPCNKKKMKVDDILAIAKNDVNLKALRGKVSHETVVFPVKNEYRLSYLVRIPALKPLGDWEVIVDSETGKVHSKMDRLVFLGGKGTAYKYNPLNSKPANMDLVNLDNSGKLQGSFIKINNDDAEEAYNANREFNYEVDDVHFDEVMAYYHFNVVHDYFKGMGFSELDRPLEAIVHYGENYDNAFYSPWSESFAFGDGNKLNNLVKEAAVVYHEYTHAVTSAILDLNGDEGGAINEGFSDYFACSMTDDPKIGEWAMKKLGKPYMRYLINDWVYPDDMQGEIHADSVIWSSALWELRKIYGKKDIDLLAHKSRYFMPKWGAKFIDGYEALIACDAEVFKGKFAKKIEEIFRRKGIVSKEKEEVREMYWRDDQTNTQINSHLYK